MSDQTSAASSPAEEVDVFQGEQPTLAEFNYWRRSGELPERFKPAETEESASDDAPEETVESEGEEPETAPASELEEEVQEQPQKGSGAEKRIKQLLAKVKDLEARLPRQDVKPESSPAQQPQQGKPTPEEKKADGTPKYATYEEFQEALTDWKVDQRLAQERRQQAEQKALESLRAKLDDARTRYEDADEVIFPAAQAIRDAQIPQIIKQVFADSDVFPDLCYVVGSDENELNKFIRLAQTDPRAALAKAFEYERGIREEFSRPEAEEPRKAPEKTQTKAPKPPSPVTGGSSRAFDVSDESLSPDEWARKRTADLKKRGR